MKKLMLSLMFVFAISLTANAMSSSEARRIALFLTDKMAYELNLTDEQYEAAYEINYDYFLNLEGYGNLYGTYWTRRNYDLSYILGSLKYARFKLLEYFYRPAYWSGNSIRYRIYSRYSNRNKFYFNHPDEYSSYNSEHSRSSNSGRSYYKGRDFNNGTGLRSAMRNGNSDSNYIRSNESNNNNGRTNNRNNSRFNTSGNNGNSNNNSNNMNNGNNSNYNNNNNNNRMNNRNGNSRNEMNNRNGNNQNGNSQNGNNKNGNFGNDNSTNVQKTNDRNNDQPNKQNR